MGNSTMGQAGKLEAGKLEAGKLRFQAGPLRELTSHKLRIASHGAASREL